jgi:LacI family transcriptional regulator
MANKRVALLIETSSSWGQQIIAGVSDYVRRNGRWILYLDHRGTYEKQSIPAWWEGEGIIARLTSTVLVQQVRMANIPCVNVSSIRIPGGSIQHVNTNEHRVGEMAAETLISAGLKHFGYFGPPRREFYHDAVFESFQRRVTQAGFSVSAIDPDRTLRSDTDPHLDLRQLGDWLLSLPKPVGICCWNALGAHRVTEACCWLKLVVPDDVSILGGDYDQLTAEIAMPQITCVDQAPRRLGFLAATELDRLMSGGKPGQPVLVEPAGILVKQTVVANTAQDPVVEEAVRLIRENSHKRYSIGQLLKALPISRRNLELRFNKALGHGPGAEIRSVRLAEAQRLLAETDLQIKEVAWRSGLNNPEQLQRLVREATSLSPSQYRHAYRRQPALGTPPPPIVSIRPPDGIPAPAAPG